MCLQCGVQGASSRPCGAILLLLLLIPSRAGAVLHSLTPQTNTSATQCCCTADLASGRRAQPQHTAHHQHLGPAQPLPQPARQAMQSTGACHTGRRTCLATAQIFAFPGPGQAYRKVISQVAKDICKDKDHFEWVGKRCARLLTPLERE